MAARVPASACGVALALWVEPVLRIAMFVAVLARAQRTGTSLALVVFDVDHFKPIIDRFGHAAGDDALRDIGDVVGGGMRRSDVFGRLGGEELALLLPDTDMAGAAVVADKLRSSLPRRAVVGPALTVSFGVAEVQGGRAAAREVFEEADRALYAAKRQGRDRVVRSDELRPRLRPAF